MSPLTGLYEVLRVLIAVALPIFTMFAIFVTASMMFCGVAQMTPHWRNYQPDACQRGPLSKPFNIHIWSTFAIGIILEFRAGFLWMDAHGAFSLKNCALALGEVYVGSMAWAAGVGVCCGFWLGIRWFMGKDRLEAVEDAERGVAASTEEGPAVSTELPPYTPRIAGEGEAGGEEERLMNGQSEDGLLGAKSKNDNAEHELRV